MKRETDLISTFHKFHAHHLCGKYLGEYSELSDFVAGTGP